MKPVCVILLCHNNLNFTKRCVESIQASFGEIYFLFIDNGSTDGTFKYLSQIKNSFIIRNKKNNFVNPAWNQGLLWFLESEFDIVCLANNDIVVHKDWLSPVLEFFRCNNNRFYTSVSNCDGLYKDLRQFRNVKTKKIRSYWTFRGGNCLFLTKEQVRYFYPIPEEILIWYGDDYIYSKLFAYGHRLYVVIGSYIFHFGAMTSGLDKFLTVRNLDNDNWQLIKENLLKEGIASIHDQKDKIRDRFHKILYL